MISKLITVEFTDNSLYTDNTTNDVIGMVMPASWGPVNKVTSVTQDKFYELFPAEATEYYAKAESCFTSGAGMMEIVRPQLESTYYHGILYQAQTTNALTLTSVRQKTAQVGQILPAPEPAIAKQLLTFSTRYPGNMPLDGEIGFNITLAVVDEVPTITISITKGKGGSLEVLATFEGGLIPGQLVDGQPYYIEDVMNKTSTYITCKVLDAQTLINACSQVIEPNKTPGYTGTIEYTLDSIDFSTLTEDDLIPIYSSQFGSINLSNATILIPTFASAKLNNAVIACASKRMNCVSIVGYPTSEAFDLDTIKEFLQTLTADKFGFFYACRDTENAKGVSFISDGVGIIAARYAATAAADTINQPPSSTTWGAFPGSIIETLDEDGVLALQEVGGNTVYTTTNGPTIWGIKTLHNRQSSYFAKVNVMRVIANLLYTTYPLLDEVHHTPNTDRKKAMVQANRQAFLDDLIAREVLKAQSTCQCDANNNKDIDTNGGELLIIDFDMWFVKLIERFKIRITASDTTTQVTIS